MRRGKANTHKRCKLPNAPKHWEPDRWTFLSLASAAHLLKKSEIMPSFDHASIVRLPLLLTFVFLAVACGNIESGKSTYSEVIATYPQGTQLCATDVSINAVGPGGSWLTSGSISIVNSRQEIKCYRTKVRLNVDGELDGTT